MGKKAEAEVMSMKTALTDEQRSVLCNVFESGGRANNDWKNAAMRAGLRRKLETISSVGALKTEEAAELVAVCNGLLERGALTFAGIELLEPIVGQLKEMIPQVE